MHLKTKLIKDAFMITSLMKVAY